MPNRCVAAACGNMPRGHANKKKFQKSKKTLEVGGWVKCPIGNNKKLENICLYIILLRFWASIRTSITL